MMLGKGHEIDHCVVAKLLQKDFKQLHIYYQIDWFLGGNCISFQGDQRCGDNKWLVIVKYAFVNNFDHFFDKIWKFLIMKSKINLKYMYNLPSLLGRYVKTDPFCFAQVLDYSNSSSGLHGTGIKNSSKLEFHCTFRILVFSINQNSTFQILISHPQTGIWVNWYPATEYRPPLP